MLAALIFAAFPQILLGLQTFVVRDFGFFSYPVAAFQRECFWRGELPLWNPYSHCGLPFLAQWNTMALYPPALIYLLLPLKWSLSFFSLVHLFWGGLGMYFLARRWSGSSLAAGLAGLIFSFNGLSLNLLMWPSHIATLSWMPWVVAATQRGWEKGGRSLGVAALVGALQMLAGAPETIFFTWSICGVFWVAHVVGIWRQSGGIRGALAPLCRFPAMVLLVAGLAAAQLLPFLDLAAHSQRGTGFADARWSMPARGWANFFVPMAFGSTVKQGLFFQHGQYWTSSYYLGIGTLVLIVVCLVSVRTLRVWLLSAGALLALILATGDQTLLSRGARHLLPQLSLMTYPVKFVVPAVFALPLLCAFGLAALEQRPASARRRVLWAASAVAAVLFTVLLWAWRFPLAGDNTPAALHNGLSRAAFLVGAVCLLCVAPTGGLPKLPGLKTAPQLLPALLLVLFWFDLWTHEPQQNPGVPSWVYQPGLARKQLALSPEPALGRSRVMLSPAAETQFRQVVLDDVKDNYLVKRLGFFADCNLLDGVPKVDGFFSLCPRECGELNSALYVSGAGCGAGLPDFLSVSHMTATNGSVAWTTRGTFLPLVTGGQSPVFLDDTNALLTLLSPKFDPRRTVLLPIKARALISMTGREPVSVTAKLTKLTARQVDVEVDAAAAALVVLGQTYYHQWQAFVDGKPAALLRANYAFQAVPVKAGRHHVQVRYVDRSFQIGSVVSVLGLAVCAGLALYPRRAGNCRRPSAP